MNNERIRAELDYDQLIYVLSHDLKAPPRALKQYLIMLQNSLGDELSEDSQHIVQRMNLVLERFDEHMEALLRLSRFGKAHGDVITIDSSRLITQLLSELGVSHQVASGLPAVRCDEERFVWLFNELALNVLAHAGSGAEITVTHDGTSFVFADNGSGIDEQFRAEVFMVFRPTQPHDSSHLCIGLCCAARIVRSLGGQMEMECPPQGGTRFFFSLPIE
jgi:light-regulated signal transduction histidine kinase (bacteriophytochrome)